VYPETERGNVVETQFGVPVADPYRWLENDVRTDPKVAEWVARQNAVTGAYLATLPARETFEQRLRTLYDYERFGVPRKAGNRYFYSRNSGLQNQAVLFVRDGLSGARAC
jgi:prolyl oligopeptidase